MMPTAKQRFAGLLVGRQTIILLYLLREISWDARLTCTTVVLRGLHGALVFETIPV
ncbi:hypothetical protein EPIR_0313 [Erwinia piriflorinigrans CFBP 5888]|uniref:Uncharacterized protein n=1 Tax=Erwinia piriflorinigrans CFBP 5888 TaxID=1161919 RepID=V5Z3Y7_9GAMM|nr:hypothetical protein EPIR_0313 [Erwinia piriflorinigrans CFBP 5888]